MQASTLKRWMVGLMLIVVSGASLHAQPNVDNGVFKSDEHGLQVKLPTGWDIGESSAPGSIAVFFSPKDKDGSLNLFHRDAKDKDANAVIAELEKEIRDHDAKAAIDTTEDAKLGGEPARQFTYRVTLAGEAKSGLMRVGVHAGKAYVFMYSEPTAVYDKGVASIKKVIDSLKWTTPKKK